jgi:uncharacterized protein involved in exopolysaccharide biosynthesis
MTADHNQGSDYDDWVPPADEAGDGGPGLPEFLFDPLGILHRRWLWMLLALLLGITASVGVAWHQQPVYVAEGTVLITSQTIPEDIVRSTVSQDSLAQINAIVGQVLSRHNLETLIRKFQLYSNDADVVLMRRDVSIQPRDDVRGGSRGVSTSQIFAITYECDDPETAANIVNELASYFMAANIAMRSRQAELTTSFLLRELESAEKELREQDRLITEFLQEHRGGLPSELTTNLARLERLQAQRQSLASQIDAAEGRIVLLNAQEIASREDDVPTPQSRLSELQAQLHAALAVLTEQHPNVIALQRQIARIEEQVAAMELIESPELRERAAVVAQAQRQLKLLRSQLADTAAQIAAIDERVEETPMRAEQLAALQERGGVLRENYVEFLRKVEEAQLAQSLESAQQGARVSVLDRATPPMTPKRPRWKVLALGLAATFMLSVGTGILLELVDPVVVSAHQLASIAERQVLGSIPTVS